MLELPGWVHIPAAHSELGLGKVGENVWSAPAHLGPFTVDALGWILPVAGGTGVERALLSCLGSAQL